MKHATEVLKTSDALRNKDDAPAFATGLLNSQIPQHLGLGLFHGKQVVAGRAVLRNAGAVFGRVAAVVAAEAAGIVHVADVVGMRPPGDFHVGEDILVVECSESFAGRLDQRRI